MSTSSSESLPVSSNPAPIEPAPASWTVKVPRLVDVQAYFKSHPDMIDVAEPICRAVRQEFGQTAELLLKVYRDPEIDDEYLALYVRLPSYEGDFLPRVRSISSAHEELQVEKSGSLLITTDFVAPQE